MTIRIDIIGQPKPGGSKRAFVRGRHAIVVDANAKVGEWKALVAAAAVAAMQAARRVGHVGPDVLTGPLAVEATFRMPRPRGHYTRCGTMLRKSAPMWPVTRPDATKLWRPTEDALTGIVWRDDSQIIRQLVRKRYCGPGEVPGAEVLVDERV
jgi:Holliday junction resolvase RusA-like endonuclease